MPQKDGRRRRELVIWSTMGIEKKMGDRIVARRRGNRRRVALVLLTQMRDDCRDLRPSRLRIAGPTPRQLGELGRSRSLSRACAASTLCRGSVRLLVAMKVRTVCGVFCNWSELGTCDTMRTTVNGGMRLAGHLDDIALGPSEEVGPVDLLDVEARKVRRSGNAVRIQIHDLQDVKVGMCRLRKHRRQTRYEPTRVSYSDAGLLPFETSLRSQEIKVE